MKREAIDIGRRTFLKSFPKEFLGGIRSVTTEVQSDSCEESSSKRIVRVDIERCLAWQGLNCQACYLACPIREKAITIFDTKPVIHAAFCDGCGKCEAACRTVNDIGAIEKVVPSRSVKEVLSQEVLS